MNIGETSADLLMALNRSGTSPILKVIDPLGVTVDIDDNDDNVVASKPVRRK